MKSATSQRPKGLTRGENGLEHRSDLGAVPVPDPGAVPAQLGPSAPDDRGRADGSAVSDGELLERFCRHRDAAAFDHLLRRYGPMVLGVCQRTLRQSQDAEDAYQATFLILVRKAATLRHPERLAGWLHGVAYRIAVRMRATAAKRGVTGMQIEQQASGSAELEATWTELRTALDEELSHLQERHRLPLILCYLQGMTHAEAAARLGWPVGSMSARIGQARERLRRRLARRGVVLTAAMLAAALLQGSSQAAVPVELNACTSHAAYLIASGKAQLADVAATSVVRLVEQSQQAMWLGYLGRLAIIAVVAAALILAGLELSPLAGLAHADSPGKPGQVPAWVAHWFGGSSHSSCSP